MIENKLYLEDVLRVTKIKLPWEKLQNSSVLITGASGLIGSFLVDVIMQLNYKEKLNCTIYAVGRDEGKAKKKFSHYWETKLFKFVQQDINTNIQVEGFEDLGYIVHLASNTHPIAYSTDPIGTIVTNIIGTKNLLDLAERQKINRFVFASSNEIYGENKGDVELFSENYCGYINSNTLRAGYPESKRCGEALCQAYRKQKGIDVVIPRLTRSYGPTMLMSDSKAISQFIKKGLENEDIVLKSEGNQFYSYTYVSDAVAGLLTVMLEGESGEAYNIADIKSDITLRELAETIAEQAHTKVVFEIPDEIEKVGYSTATKARLDGTKIQQLGWSAQYDIETGIKRTMKILKAIN